MAMTRVGGANGAMSRDLAPLQAPTPAVQTANQTIPRLSTGVEYVLSSAGVANGQIVVNFHTGAARPELAEFTTGGVMMQVDKFMAWGLTKTAWATVGLTDFQGEWEVQFDYSIPSSRFSQFNGYLYMVLDRSVGNVRQIGDVLFGWMSGRCDTYGANVVVVTPNPPDTCSLLALTDVPFRMLVSRDATTGYLTIKIYRTDTMALQVEVEVQRDTPFTEDVPISFYINDMRLDWSDVRVLRGSTMSGGTGGGSGEAVGDPHLQNVHGERFDLMQEGRHVLINIPRGTGAEQAILRVQADARRLGGQCADLYFQELNVTGSWAEAKQAGGYHYSVSQSDAETPKWVALGKVPESRSGTHGQRPQIPERVREAPGARRICHRRSTGCGRPRGRDDPSGAVWPEAVPGPGHHGSLGVLSRRGEPRVTAPARAAPACEAREGAIIARVQYPQTAFLEP